MCYLCAWQATRMISDASIKWSVCSQKIIIRTAVTVFVRWTPTLELNLVIKTEENRHSEKRSRCLLGGCLLCVVHDRTTERCLQEKDPSLKIQSLSPKEHVDFKKVGFLISPCNESCFCHLRNGSSRQMQRKKTAGPILLQLNSSRKNFIRLWSKLRDSRALLLLGLSPWKLPV